MRISDWSSDGCSSDLQHVARIEVVRGRGMADVRDVIDPLAAELWVNGFVRHRPVETQRGPRIAKDLRDVAQLPVPGLAFPEKIGRSSSWERMVLFVYILLDAGPFIKT